MIKYPVALDADGNMVSACEAIKQQDYFCICHKCHKRMRVVEGPFVQRHFRHIDMDVEHSGETFLHEYSKHYIKQKILNSDRFFIGFNIEEKCGKEVCGFDIVFCKRHKPVIWDLKQYCYDKVELEKNVDTGKGIFRPDVLLTSSKYPKMPIFIEVEVTSPCTEEKLQSGTRIIEIKLPMNYDVANHPFEFDGLIEGEDENGIGVKFYNFERRNSVSEKPYGNKEIKAIIKKENGDVIFLFNNVDCSKYGTKIWRDSVCEVHYAIDYNDKIPLTSLKAIAALNGIPCRNCRFCSHLDFEYGRFNNRKILICGHSKEIIRKGNEADSCPNYRFSEYDALEWASRIEERSYVVVDKNGKIVTSYSVQERLEKWKDVLSKMSD